MIHYRISPLDSNKTILEQLEDIKKYLTENFQYQVFYYNGNYINTTNTYEVTNLVLNARTINKGDIVLFANSYYAVVDAIGNNNFVVEHAIEMNSQALIDLKNYVINNYQTKLTFDNIPKSGSNNPVTSDGIKKAITETIQTEHQVPSGGIKNQVLGKLSNNDYDYNWIDLYPVGSIYMSVNDTSPASLFGGSWEKIKDTFLLSSGDTYVNGNSGGETTHTLTTGEIPSHHHTEQFGNGAYSTWEGITYSSQQGTRTLSGVELPNYNYRENLEGTYDYLFTGFEGNSQAHNNMPPYLVVNMWKRIT